MVGNISVRFKKHLPVWSAGHFEDVSEIYRLFCIAICLGGRKVSRCDECSLELLRLNLSIMSALLCEGTPYCNMHITFLATLLGIQRP